MLFITLFIIFIIIILILYLLFIALQKRLIFYPTKLESENQFSDFIKQNGIIHNIQINPNIILSSVIFENDNTDKYLIYAHGNSYDVNHLNDVYAIYGKYFNLIVFDYRGFGLSSGEITEKGLYEDYKYIVNYYIKKYNIKKLTLYGYSLGCSIVSHYVANNYFIDKLYLMETLTVVLQSGFYNIQQIIMDYFKIKVPSILIGFKFNNAKNVYIINQIFRNRPNNHLILIHSVDDDIIPYKQTVMIHNELVQYDNKYHNTNRHQFLTIHGTHVHNQLGPIIPIIINI